MSVLLHHCMTARHIRIMHLRVSPIPSSECGHPSVAIARECMELVTTKVQSVCKSPPQRSLQARLKVFNTEPPLLKVPITVARGHRSYSKRGYRDAVDTRHLSFRAIVAKIADSMSYDVGSHKYLCRWLARYMPSLGLAALENSSEARPSYRI